MKATLFETEAGVTHSGSARGSVGYNHADLLSKDTYLSFLSDPDWLLNPKFSEKKRATEIKFKSRSTERLKTRTIFNTHTPKWPETLNAVLALSSLEHAWQGHIHICCREKNTLVANDTIGSASFSLKDVHEQYRLGQDLIINQPLIWGGQRTGIVSCRVSLKMVEVEVEVSAAALQRWPGRASLPSGLWWPRALPITW